MYCLILDCVLQIQKLVNQTVKNKNKKAFLDIENSHIETDTDFKILDIF